jgi:hypothetical protein
MVHSKVYASAATLRIMASSLMQYASLKLTLVSMVGRSIQGIASIIATLQRGKIVMNEAEQDRKQHDVKAIIDDAIVSLIMQGLTNLSALKLLMIQAAIRIDNAADVREVLKSIADMLVDGDDDDGNDDDPRGREAA